MIKKDSGFTLIELMVAIVIISIISFITVPKFLFMITAAKQATTKGYIATMRSVTDLYYSDNVFYPYQYASLPYTDTDGLACDTIKTQEQKKNNVWVPKYMSRWIPAIRVGEKPWVSTTTGKMHEKGNDLRVLDLLPGSTPYVNHDWPEEIIYARTNGQIYVNCNLTDKDGKPIYDW